MAAPSTSELPAAAQGLAQIFDLKTARGRLLVAGAQLFAMKGVQGPTVEEILHAAQVSRRTFYKHFDNREELLVELHRVLSERVLLATADAAASSTSPSERIERSLDVLLATAQRGGALFRVLQAEAMRPGSKLAPRRQQVFARLIEMQQAAIVAAGQPAPDALYLHGLNAGVEAILHRGAAEGPLDDERLARIRREMARLMAAALAGAS